MVIVSELFLVRFRYCEISGGMMICSVCGSMISDMVWCGCRFSVKVVLDWLWLMVRMFVCMILVMNVLV